MDELKTSVGVHTMKTLPEFEDLPIIYVVIVLAHFGLCLEADQSGGFRAVPA